MSGTGSPADVSAGAPDARFGSGRPTSEPSPPDAMGASVIDHADLQRIMGKLADAETQAQAVGTPRMGHVDVDAPTRLLSGLIASRRGHVRSRAGIQLPGHDTR